MNNRIYVGNVSWGTTEIDLKDLFSQYGVVQDCKIVTDRETGRSRGFAFVTLDSEAAVNRAIEALNGQEYDGRALTVNIAREREPRRDNRGDRRDDRRGGRRENW